MLGLSLRPDRVGVQFINGVQLAIHPLVPHLEVPQLSLLHAVGTAGLGVAAVHALDVISQLGLTAYCLGHDRGLVLKLFHFEGFG